jgi:hypothetical protein
MMSLPKEMNYSSDLSSIPDGVTNRVISVLPSNGSTFQVQNGNLIQFDIPSAGFMQPDTLSISYKYKILSTGATQIRSCPLYTLFSRSELFFGSQIVESITGYNQLMNLLTNVTMDVSQKLGEISLGYSTANGQQPSLAHADGSFHVTNASGYFSGKLPNLLSNAQKLVPLEIMPQIRLQLSLDSIQNIFSPPATAVVADQPNGVLATPEIVRPDSMSISDVTLTYNSISVPSAVVDMIRNMDDVLYIKSQSFSTTGVTIPAGSSGNIQNVYNQRIASLKAIFLLNSSSSTNGIFDSFNLSPRCSYQFDINSILYPQRPITRESSLMVELKKACGSLYDKSNVFAINLNEFNYELGDTTTIAEPSKFFIGCSTELTPFSTGLLSGVSTESSPISVILNIETPLPKSVTSTLLCNYDVLIELQPASRNASVKQ